MRWFIYMLLGTVFAMLAFTGLWFHSAGIQQAPVAWINNYYQAKTLMLESHTDNGRLVIIAGSNGLFAFDSEVLTRQLSLPVVNYSSAAGLGLRYLLERAKSNLRPFDTVLLPLEYLFYNDAVVTDVTLPLHAISHPDTLQYFPALETASIVMHTPFNNVLFPVTTKTPSMRDELFKVSNLNAHGDIQSSVVSRLYDKHGIANHQFSMADAEALNKRSEKILHEFVTWAKANNIRVIAMPPAVQRHPGLMTAESLQNKKLIKHMWASLDVPFLISHEKVEFDKKYMFDTAYHLNHNGRERFMNLILSPLQHSIQKNIKLHSTVAVPLN